VRTGSSNAVVGRDWSAAGAARAALNLIRPVAPVWAAALVFVAAAIVVCSLIANKPVLHQWVQWDAEWFNDIARGGYYKPGTPAFYPLYPGFERALGTVLGGNVRVSGVVVSVLASLVCFTLLYRLAADLFDNSTALRATLYLALFPYALFLQVAYSESLFLCFAIGAFLAAERGRYWVSGTLVGLAFLTRPVSVALLIAIVVLALGRRRFADAARAVAAAIPGALLYPLLLAQQGHSPVAFLHVEELWERRTSSYGPLGGVYEGMKAGWAAILQLTFGSDKPYWNPYHPYPEALINLSNLIALCVLGVLTLLVFRHLGLAYGIYCVAAVAIPLSIPSESRPLLSMGRFGLVLFPAFIALASLQLSARVHAALYGISGALLIGVVYWWTTGQFVA
jgi:4-amino-4-deoxy-L-arabinose transferase-like glycosyltransferase